MSSHDQTSILVRTGRFANVAMPAASLARADEVIEFRDSLAFMP